MGTRRIGELLVAEGLLSEAAVNRALSFQRLSGERVRIGTILLNWELLAEEALLATLAKFHHCPAVDWPTLTAADIGAVRLLTEAQAVRLAAIPYRLEKGALKIAFANPSDLAAVDESSALTGKRVIGGVTIEVRLMQAHQKFYGRHIPREFRAIVQKLGRKTGTLTRQSLQAPPPPDFSAPEVAETATESSVRISVSPEAESLSPPELPSVERPLASESPSILSGPPLESPALLLNSTADMATANPAPLTEDPIRAGGDSLAEWVGDALSSFQQERGPAQPSVASLGASVPPVTASTTPRRPPAQWSPEDVISGMWRASRLEETDDIAAGMWTSQEETSSHRKEARSREEIGETVLQNALTHLPRVLLFGAGKISVFGWRGRGPGLSSERIASVRIPVTGNSVFSRVQSSGVPHFGPVDRAEWPRELALLGESPVDCAIFPIRILDGIAAFLYADRLGRPMLNEDFAAVARAAASTANALARFLLRPNTTPVR